MIKKTFKERLKYIFIKFLLVSAFVFFAVLWVCSWSYSEGTRSGNLIKVSKKGVIFKSFEGQLNIGGISMASGNGTRSPHVRTSQPTAPRPCIPAGGGARHAGSQPQGVARQNIELGQIVSAERAHMCSEERAL